jgi:hypothetical protein
VSSLATPNDTIVVAWAEGTFHAVKLTVRGSPIRIRRVIVHFERGEPLELALHGLVPDGGESRTIHVKGERRAIRSVDVWYDPNSVSHTGAVVELDGRD